MKKSFFLIAYISSTFIYFPVYANNLPIQETSILIKEVDPISSAPILSNTKEIKGEVTELISIKLAAGEIESASFVLISDRLLTDIKINYGDLVGDNSFIRANNIDIKLVKEWYQADQAWFGRYGKMKKKILVPELLLNNDKLVKVDYIKKKTI